MTRVLVLITACFAMMPAAHAATVPSVGCASDGQLGPEVPPAGGTRHVAIEGSAAANLAWYFHSSIGVLAPRGWHCLVLSGSGGTNLYVTPQQLSSEEMFRSGFKGIQGPAIQLSVAEGDTSGRFVAARRIARLFPHERQFVDAVIAENIEPASAFPSGPYPRDTLIRRGANVFEYETQADASGLGYDSRLAPGDRPITGVVILLDRDRSVLTLAVRLPRELRNADGVIVRQVEADNPPMRVGNELRVVTGEAAARLFVYANKPIHPFCVDFPFDSARWDAIILSRCSSTPVVPTAGSDGWREADYPRESGPSGYSSYVVLASKGDRFLLGTANSGGGSGQFSSLRWVSLAQDQLRLSTDEMGGDRCVGGLYGYDVIRGVIEFNRNVPASAIVSLSGVVVDQSIMGQLHGRPPDCNGAARYRYDPALEKMQLVSVKINVPDQPKATAMDPQACFDRLVRKLGKHIVLKPGELAKFGETFLKTCVSNAHQ